VVDHREDAGRAQHRHPSSRGLLLVDRAVHVRPRNRGWRLRGRHPRPRHPRLDVRLPGADPRPGSGLPVVPAQRGPGLLARLHTDPPTRRLVRRLAGRACAVRRRTAAGNRTNQPGHRHPAARRGRGAGPPAPPGGKSPLRVRRRRR
jgi:hypothetical protein